LSGGFPGQYKALRDPWFLIKGICRCSRAQISCVASAIGKTREFRTKSWDKFTILHPSEALSGRLRLVVFFRHRHTRRGPQLWTLNCKIARKIFHLFWASQPQSPTTHGRRRPPNNPTRRKILCGIANSGWDSMSASSIQLLCRVEVIDLCTTKWGIPRYNVQGEKQMTEVRKPSFPPT